MVKTKTNYSRNTAKNYDAVRLKQARWHAENAAVDALLAKVVENRRVLDCPVGTGRFLESYRKRRAKSVVGIDVSQDMVAEAQRKAKPADLRAQRVVLRTGDAGTTELASASIDVTVSVRFLNLITETELASVMKEFTRVTRERLILTIRLGDVYHEKTVARTHDRKKFLALMSKLGWQVEEDVPGFKQGWALMMFNRKEKTK